MDGGYFEFSSKVENLLFKDLSVSTYKGMAGLCLGIAVFTFLYEAVKSLRHYIVILHMRRKSNPNVTVAVSEGENNSQQKPLNCFNYPPQKTAEKLKFHCFQTILYMVQLSMGYMIMLIIMSYNAWFLITIILVTAVCFYFHEFVLSRKPMTLPVEIPSTNL